MPESYDLWENRSGRRTDPLGRDRLVDKIGGRDTNRVNYGWTLLTRKLSLTQHFV